MRSRFQLSLVLGSLVLGLVPLGCSDSIHAGPLSYVVSPDAQVKLKDRPKLQEKVRLALADLFGPDPQHIKVPEGSGLPNAGIYLGNYVLLDEKKGFQPIENEVLDDSGKAIHVPQPGGFGLYRLHCSHCHGVSGAGDGPTAPFLYPRPRDYRKGWFKFTSTTTVKPTREDLRKTIKYGLHGTSMPAFEPLMSASELEQVLDYVIFLSMRGEVEINLIDEASFAEESDANALASEDVRKVAAGIFARWKAAEGQVLNPPVRRTPSTRASILRGRDLFLSRNKEVKKADCTSCHGPQGVGNGPSFVEQEVFNNVVFGGNPSQEAERLAQYDKAVQDLWSKSLDDWNNPLRPANLNRGVYKGGRRPIDIYWRIAKGINGAKMPAHYPDLLGPEQIWDLVNFVLQLPYEPELLKGATLPAAPPATVPPAKVAGR